MSSIYRMLIGPTHARLENYLEAPPSHPTFDKEETLVNKIRKLNNYASEIQTHINKIQTAHVYLEKQHAKWIDYIQSLSPESATKEEALHDNYATETNFIETMDNAADKLEEFKGKKRQAENEIKSIKDDMKRDKSESNDKKDDENEDAENYYAQQVIRQTVKLPKLEIRPFYGDITKYQEFMDAFTKVIDRQPINNASKIEYLFSYLRDDAYAAVQGYRHIAANYPIVLDILKRRFGNITLIKYTLQTELRNLSPCIDDPRTRQPKLSQFRALYENIERICRQLEELGEDTSHPQIALCIESKLPLSVLEELYKQKGPFEEWDPIQMREKLNSIIETKEHIRRRFRENAATTTRTSTDRRNRTDEHSTQTATFSVHAAPRPPYAFCSGNHRYNDLQIYQDPIRRARRPRELQLRSGHQFRTNCIRKQCRTFSSLGDHHSALYPNREPIPQTPRSDPYQAQFSQQQTFPPRIKIQRAMQNTVVHAQRNQFRQTDSFQMTSQGASNTPTTSAQNEPAIMNMRFTEAPTDKANESENAIFLARNISIFNPTKPDSPRKLLIMFNDCCNKSYIKEIAARGFYLKAKKHLSIYTFDNTAPAVRHSALTEFGLLLPNNSIILIKANIVKHINEPIKVILATEHQLLQQKNDDGTEFSTTKAQPDILIGADHFWTLFKNMKTTGQKHGLTLLPSKTNIKANYSTTKQKPCTQSVNHNFRKVNEECQTLFVERSTKKMAEMTPSQPRTQNRYPQTKQFAPTAEEHTASSVPRSKRCQSHTIESHHEHFRCKSPNIGRKPIVKTELRCSLKEYWSAFDSEPHEPKIHDWKWTRKKMSQSRFYEKSLRIR